MSVASQPVGAAAVGLISELDSIRAASVLYLRLWCDSPETRSEVRQDFAVALGAGQGAQAVQSLSELCTLCVAHGRRPLVRHAVQCRCLGSDESCFANFIATAAEGDREDAMLIATLLVRADMAPALTALAADLGLALRRMRLSTPRDMSQAKPQSATLH